MGILEVWRTRPSGAKSFATIFGPLVPMTCEAAAETRANSRKAAGSRPSRSAKTSPSASARRLRPRMRLIASLARPPSPTLPIWWRLGTALRGRGSSASLASPPMRPTPSPWGPVRWCPIPALPESAIGPPPAHRAPHPVGIAGRGADHDLAGRGGKERAFDDIFGLIGREHRDHDRIAVAGNVGKRSGAAADAQAARCAPHRCRSPSPKNPQRSGDARRLRPSGRGRSIRRWLECSWP